LWVKSNKGSDVDIINKSSDGLGCLVFSYNIGLDKISNGSDEGLEDKWNDGSDEGLCVGYDDGSDEGLWVGHNNDSYDEYSDKDS
jgi:hypothetical protein